MQSFTSITLNCWHFGDHTDRKSAKFHIYHTQLLTFRGPHRQKECKVSHLSHSTADISGTTQTERVQSFTSITLNCWHFGDHTDRKSAKFHIYHTQLLTFRGPHRQKECKVSHLSHSTADISGTTQTERVQSFTSITLNCCISGTTQTERVQGFTSITLNC